MAIVQRMFVSHRRRGGHVSEGCAGQRVDIRGLRAPLLMMQMCDPGFVFWSVIVGDPLPKARLLSLAAAGGA